MTMNVKLGGACTPAPAPKPTDCKPAHGSNGAENAYKATMADAKKTLDQAHKTSTEAKKTVADGDALAKGGCTPPKNDGPKGGHKGGDDTALVPAVDRLIELGRPEQAERLKNLLMGK